MTAMQDGKKFTGDRPKGTLIFFSQVNLLTIVI